MVNEKSKITRDNLWKTIEENQGETIYTVKKLPFTYTVKGGELFTERKKKSITRATFEKAYEKLEEDTEGKIRGPKALNCFGGPYIWAIFLHLGIVGAAETEKNRSSYKNPVKTGNKD